MSGLDPTPESKKLWEIFHQFDEFNLSTRPEEATIEGNHRYDNKLTDLSEENIKFLYDSLRKFLFDLSTISYQMLDKPDKINYDLFKYYLTDSLESEKFNFHYMPLWQQNGIHISISKLAELQPSASDKDALNYLSRLNGFEKQVNDIINNIRKGIKAKLVMPGFIIKQTIPQIENLLNIKPEVSVFYALYKNNNNISKNINNDILFTISNNLYPALEKLNEFIKNEYLPSGRNEAGIWSLPDGNECYRYLVKSFTSLNLSPEEIHNTGLSEIARIEKEMNKLIIQLNFTGSINDFNQYLRTDPSFYFTKKEDLINGFRQILDRMDKKLPEIFGRLPKTGYDLKEIEEFAAESAPAAYYFPPALDGSRMGYFYVNTFNLESRPKYEMTALALHEAVPGHHLQIALAQELDNLPKFRRDWSGATAYVEGWALYSESLGYSTGMYDDPYQRYGALSLEIWRAVRLVVDTGIHYKKWTREEAIAFMELHTANSEHDIHSEVDRYIAWPGQALAYKTGELKIKELRKLAETSLNGKFNIKDFHDTLLLNGALPLTFLDKVVKEWIDGI